MSKQLSVLAVGAHPDDTEFRCGGTLARYASAGHHVTMCYVTRGDKGHLRIPPDELAKIREKEARAAAAVIGAEVIWMDYPDGELYVTPETRMAFLDMVRQANPDIIFTHSREAYHPDHVAVSELVFAANYLSTVPHLKTAHPAIDHVPLIYYIDVHTGTQLLSVEYVNISDFIDQKIKMARAHASQIEWLREHDHIDVIERLIAENRGWGIRCGTKYAERFVLMRTDKTMPVDEGFGAIPFK
jgi:LmbE family N-acetylglucosaminyl deacetylase